MGVFKVLTTADCVFCISVVSLLKDFCVVIVIKFKETCFGGNFVCAQFQVLYEWPTKKQIANCCNRAINHLLACI